MKPVRNNIPYGELTPEEQTVVRWWMAFGVPFDFSYHVERAEWNKAHFPGKWYEMIAKEPGIYDHLHFRLRPGP